MVICVVGRVLTVSHGGAIEEVNANGCVCCDMKVGCWRHDRWIDIGRVR